MLVHGAYHGPWCWEDNFKPFFVKRGYSVIVVNFSNPNPKVKINDYMEHLNEVVGEISGKVYIISHSLGTAIVEKYITKFSPKLEAVVFLTPSPVIKSLQKAFLVNFHNIMRSKSCFYFSNRLDESVESVYLDKFTDESRQIELLMIRKKVPVGYEWNYKTLGTPRELSGGVKTLILIDQVPDKVFNASTCGDNCAHWLLKMGMEKNITINLRHLMDFGEQEFTIHILNTDEIVHNMEELVMIAGMFVR